MRPEPCPRCHTTHYRGLYCRMATECGARLDDPFAAVHARCILQPNHRSPSHWGPDQHQTFQQWSNPNRSIS